jgi:hypothetical protein
MAFPSKAGIIREWRARIFPLPPAHGGDGAGRSRFTSALANQNVPAELRMKLTGHSTEGEHKKYTYHEMENLRAAVGKIPTLG